MQTINWALARKRPILEQRARILQEIRAFFIARGYLEVETPQRLPGNAPETYIEPIASEGWFLQTSPELCLKRLLAAGYPQLFQISHCWRQGERGSRHLPEYTMLEWYRAGVDYHHLMTECEELLRHLAPAGTLQWQGRRLDLSPPWDRLTVQEAFLRWGETTVAAALAKDRFDELLAVQIEPHLGWPKPTFLCEYPASLAALARRKPDDPEVAERFELYLAGMELANAFSELTDSGEQRQRFEQEERQRRSAGKPPYPMPESFLQELASMPPAAGIALGIDRLVMLLTGATTIDEVVAFTPEIL
ncbi:MAG: EF-P lysine aminoacylase GenX [Desulfuromonadales bacterium]|nr:EF-P lysine aminoacylase GenX [Desulfuromonadales bacterium]